MIGYAAMGAPFTRIQDCHDHDSDVVDRRQSGCFVEGHPSQTPQVAADLKAATATTVESLRHLWKTKSLHSQEWDGASGPLRASRAREAGATAPGVQLDDTLTTGSEFRANAYPANADAGTSIRSSGHAVETSREPSAIASTHVKGMLDSQVAFGRSSYDGKSMEHLKTAREEADSTERTLVATGRDLQAFANSEESTILFMHVFKCAGSTLRYGR